MFIYFRSRTSNKKLFAEKSSFNEAQRSTYRFSWAELRQWFNNFQTESDQPVLVKPAGDIYTTFNITVFINQHRKRKWTKKNQKELKSWHTLVYGCRCAGDKWIFKCLFVYFDKETRYKRSFWLWLDIRGVSGYELHSCVFTCLLPYSGIVPCQHALGNDPCCW